MGQRFPRRRFIASVAGPVLASFARGGRVRAQAEHPVVIVGGGLAGLRAADLIRSAGRRVIVLEAQNSPGGRVRTLRAPFADGLHGEAGAARFANAHGRVMRLCTEMRLTLAPFGAQSGDAVIATPQGRWRLPAEWSAAAGSLKLRSDEAGMSPGRLLQRYVGTAATAVKEPGPSAETFASWHEYDRVTWPVWLQSRGASAGAVTLLTLGGDSRELSALYVLRQIALLGGSNQFFTVEGGMGLLAQALARRVPDSIRYNAVVMRVEQSGGAVAVGYLDRGRPTSVAASRVIFTNPFSTLRHVTIKPALPAQKARAVAEMSYYPATRLLLQTRTRFWEKEGLSGAARTSDPSEWWDAANQQDGARGLLAASVGRPAARPITLATGLEIAARAFPGIRTTFERGAVVSWSDEPWARGAFAVFHPGQMTAWVPEMSRAEGRLHFAGEHTSPWSGWMEGALESAERVAREVLQ